MRVFLVASWFAACGGGQSPPDIPPIDAGPDATLSSAKDITSFTLLAADNGLSADATAEITGTDITATARFAPSVTALKATFSTTGVDVTVGGTSQISGVTANNFTTPVTYTVVAEDGSTRRYTVTVAAPGFAPKVDFATGVNPGSVAIGDFNADGKPDLVVANNNSTTVSILVNATATGATVPSLTKVDFVTGSGPASVAIGDFNGDGKPDLAISNQGADTISVLLNKTVTGATPSFSPKVDFATGAGPTSLVIGDVNGDGKPDLAVANASNADTVSILLNTTSTGATAPTFSAKVDFATGPSPFSIAIGDLNGDGKPDLVASNVGFFRPVAVLLNTTAVGATTPTFAAKVDVLMNENTGFVTIGDLNGDSNPDLVIADANPIVALVMLNTTAMDATTLSFAPLSGFVTSSPSAIAIGDLNADGKPDLASASSGAQTVSALLNTTATGALTPSFLERVRFSTGGQPNSVAISDLNNDGKPDLAAANGNTATVSVLLAQ